VGRGESSSNDWKSWISTKKGKISASKKKKSLESFFKLRSLLIEIETFNWRI